MIVLSVLQMCITEELNSTFLKLMVFDKKCHNQISYLNTEFWLLISDFTRTFYFQLEIRQLRLVSLVCSNWLIKLSFNKSNRKIV